MTKVEEKEYATFSAQFPPPDIHLLFDQLGGHVSRNTAWQQNMKAPVFLPGSDPLNDSYECPVHTMKPLPPHFSGFLEDSMKCTLPRQRSSSSTSSLSSSYQEIPGSPSKKLDFPEPTVKTRNRSRKHSRRSADRNSRLTPHDELDVRPKVLPNKHENDRENTYLDLNEAVGPNEEEPVPMQDNPFGTKHRHKPNQKSRIFKKYREMYCASFPNDTTSEYIGKLPKKDTGYSMSRDSGVNCVGLNQGESLKVVHSVSKTVEKTALNNQNSQAQPQPQEQHQPQQQQQQHQQQQVLELNNLRFVQTTFHNDGANSVTVHKAQIHCIPEASQEDSGFNSPRLDTLDSLNSTPNTTPQTDATDVQNNLKKNEPEPQVGPASRVHKDGFSKSIDNLRGEGIELGNSGMWSSSSQQTVREAKPIPHLPPPREWTLPRPVLRDQNEAKRTTFDDSELPREGSPTRNDRTERIEHDQKRHSTIIHEKNNDVRAELNGKSGFRLSVSLKESFVNRDVKPKTQEANGHSQSNYFSMDRKKNKAMKKEGDDKVKRNLGNEFENAREGTRLHQRVFQEYHSNNHHHHSKTSLNGNVQKGDFEVVGIV